MAKSRISLNGIAFAGLASLAACVAPEKGLSRIVQNSPQVVSVPVNDIKPDRVDYSTSVKDKYLARIGLVFFDEPVLQTSLDYSLASLHGARFGYFENRLLGNGEMTEVDATASYGSSNGTFDTSVKANYIFLDSFTNFSDVLELTARASTKTLPLTLGLEANAMFSRDNNRDVGFEYILSARRDFDLAQSLTANAWTDLHFNSHYFTPDSAFSISNVGAGLNWDVFRNGLVNLGVSGQQQYTLGDNFEDQSLVGFSIGGGVSF